MPRTKPPYSPEFRQHFVDLLLSSGRPLSQVSKRPGIAPRTLAQWRNAAWRNGSTSLPRAPKPDSLQREVDYLRILPWSWIASPGHSGVASVHLPPRGHGHRSHSKSAPPRRHPPRSPFFSPTVGASIRPPKSSLPLLPKLHPYPELNPEKRLTLPVHFFGGIPVVQDR
ncbi:MAG: Transposase [Verrucomicrobiota bacterium]|jgi:hypothetical protein